jgi:hypothetical protein
MREFLAGTHAEDWEQFIETESLHQSQNEGQSLGQEVTVNATDLKAIQDKAQRNWLRLNVRFGLKSAMLTGTYKAMTETDKEQLTEVHGFDMGQKSTRKPVLTGKAVRGALRQRGRVILNAIGEQQPDCHLDQLFGYVDEKVSRCGKRPSAMQSRLWISETILADDISGLAEQIRVSVDRFTGGARESLLFGSAPLWPKEHETPFTIRMRIAAPEEWETGLLLQLLKDLWTEDLPIGGEKGIGRGLLTGHHAEIILPKGEKLEIERVQDHVHIKVSEDDRTALNLKATELWNKFN